MQVEDLFLVSHVDVSAGELRDRDPNIPCYLLGDGCIMRIGSNSKVWVNFHELRVPLDQCLSDMVCLAGESRVLRTRPEDMPSVVAAMLDLPVVAIAAHPDTPWEHYEAFKCPVVLHRGLAIGVVYACAHPEHVGEVRECAGKYAIVCWGEAGIVAMAVN